MLFSSCIKCIFCKFGLHSKKGAEKQVSNPEGLLFQQLGKQRPWTAGGAAIFLKRCTARIFVGRYFFDLVGALGMLLHPNPNLSVSRAPSENPDASNSIDAKITQIVKPPISGYHGIRLKGDGRSHSQASALILFRLFLEPHQIREDCGSPRAQQICQPATQDS